MIRGLREIACPAMVAMLLLQACTTDPFNRNRVVDNLDEGEDRLTQAQRALKNNPNDRNARIQVFYERYKSINEQFILAEAAYEAGDFEAARRHFNTVLQLDPGNPRAIASLKKLETSLQHNDQIAIAKQLLSEGKQDEGYKLLREVLVENPDHAEAGRLAQDIEAQVSADRPLIPPKLALKDESRVSLEFRDANLRSIFEVIARSSGINIMLDPNVRADLKASIFVKNASVTEVLDYLLLMHQLGKKVLTENSILIYPNTKALQYEELILRTFYLNHADATKTASLIKAMLPIRDVFVDEQLNMISLKAPHEQMLNVEKLIFDEDLPDPEVLLDVEILEINRTRLTDIGIAFPDTFTLLSSSDLNNDDDDGVDGDGDGTPDNPSLTVRDLRSISGRRIGISPGLAIRLLRQDGDSNLLANPRIRVKNREKAKIHIGDKIPIPVTTVGAGNNSFIGQSANYLDVGLKLDVEPRVMLNNEVTIRISLEVSNATFFAGSLFPTIGTRNTSTVLMSGDGETQVLAGLISDEERNNIQRVPGLSNLPFIGRLFSKPREDDARTEIVLLITPHVVRNIQRPSASDAQFYLGSGIRNSQVISPAARQVPALPATLPNDPGTDSTARQQPQSPSARDDDSNVPSPGEYDTGPNIAFPPGTVNPLGEPVYGR